MKTVQNSDRRLTILYTVLDYIRLALIVSVVVSLLTMVVFRNKTVEGDSMYPTLEDKERVLINVAASYIGDIGRFDIVVVKGPEGEDEWVKRIIGLPGEHIAYQDDVLYVNHEVVREDFLDKEYVEANKKSHQVDVFTADFSITLGADEYLLMGDNRRESLDSRNHAVGPFSRSSIIARGLFIYSPIQKARYIQNGS